jgi:transposase-like protein
MIDFPLDGLLDEQACLIWLEQSLHPDGLRCPRCGGSERRRARPGGAIPSFRCKGCGRYYTALTGTAFEKTRQAPSTLVLMLRGIAKGEPTARLAREMGVSRKQMHTRRHRVQDNLYETLPTDALDEPAFEADELYQNAGEKRSASSGRGRPAPTAGQQAARSRHL